MSRWGVWSQDVQSGRWVQVREDSTEHEARAAVARMEATAAKHDVPGAWQALPEGQAPSTRNDADHGRVGIPSGDEGR